MTKKYFIQLLEEAGNDLRPAPRGHGTYYDIYTYVKPPGIESQYLQYFQHSIRITFCRQGRYTRRFWFYPPFTGKEIIDYDLNYIKERWGPIEHAKSIKYRNELIKFTDEKIKEFNIVLNTIACKCYGD